MKNDIHIDREALAIYKHLRESLPVQIQVKMSRALRRMNRLSNASPRPRGFAPSKARHFRRWKRHARQVIQRLGYVMLYRQYNH